MSTGPYDKDYIFRQQQQQLDAELQEMGADVTDPASMPINTWRTRQDVLLATLLTARIVAQQDQIHDQLRSLQRAITVGLALLILTIVSVYVHSSW